MSARDWHGKRVSEMTGDEIRDMAGAAAGVVKTHVQDLPERLRMKIMVNSETGCWEWQGGRNDQGYGVTSWQGRRYRVHRLVYALLIGAIPDGLTLDHVKARGCTSRACCWPAHLEPVTPGENSRRAESYWGSKTHCPAGHEYTTENTLVGAKGDRSCRACRRERHRLARQENPEAVRDYEREYMSGYRDRTPGYRERAREYARTARLAGRSEGGVHVCLEGTSQDVERLAALLADGCGLEVLDHSAPYANRRDPGERVYLTVRVVRGGQR